MARLILRDINCSIHDAEALVVPDKQNQGNNSVRMGHIDDVLFVMSDNADLQDLIDRVVELCNKVKWAINRNKSILTPVKEITFLGATWAPWE